MRNAERIYAEIKTQAALAEQEIGIPADELTVLVMEIVNVEHEHQTKFTAGVNIKLENMIDQAAKAYLRLGNE